MSGGEGWEEKIRVELRFFFGRYDFCRRRLSGPLVSQADSELHPNLYFCRWSFGFKGHIRLRKKRPHIGKNGFFSIVKSCNARPND